MESKSLLDGSLLGNLREVLALDPEKLKDLLGLVRAILELVRLLKGLS